MVLSLNNIECIKITVVINSIVVRWHPFSQGLSEGINV